MDDFNISLYIEQLVEWAYLYLLNISLLVQFAAIVVTFLVAYVLNRYFEPKIMVP